MRLGRYEVTGLLGEGGQGRVHVARDPVLARDVAIKVPHGAWWGQDDVLAEARALARLRHASIVQVLDAGREAGTAFVVMELVEGEDLESLIAARRRPMDPAEALLLLEGPASAIDHARAQGILHRDLKPGNILVPSRRAGQAVLPAKVMDFGLATLAARHGMDRSPVAEGDPRHVAPEAWKGSPEPSSDIFALATVFFRLVTLQSPTPGASPAEWIAAAGRPERRRLREFRSELPAELDEVLGRAMSPRPQERPESAVALLASLRSGLERSAERREFLDDARERIREHDRIVPQRSCAECGKALSPRALTCPFCP